MKNHIAFNVGNGKSIHSWENVRAEEIPLAKNYWAISTTTRYKKERISDLYGRSSKGNSRNLGVVRGFSDWEVEEVIAL